MNYIVFLFFCQLCLSQLDERVWDIEDDAQQLRQNMYFVKYDVRTDNGFGTDCMKAITYFDHMREVFFRIAVFQKLDQQTGYFSLYYAESYQQDVWTNTVKLSQRGTKGTILKISDYNLLVAYQLQDKEKGSTIAIRFYQDLYELRENNFYEYQLSKQVLDDHQNIINIGSPRLQIINPFLQDNYPSFDQNYPSFDQYKLKIIFSYSDTHMDYPGYGFVNLNPSRDFLSQNGNRIKQNYDWKGYKDHETLSALRQAGCNGTVQHSDNLGEIYYFYDCNINPQYDWSSWRVYLYSPYEKKAVDLGFDFDGNINMLCPSLNESFHRFFFKGNIQLPGFSLQMSFFLPSQGVPGTQSRAGQVTVKSHFTYGR